MNKNNFLKICLLAALGLASVVFNACKKDEPDKKSNNTLSVCADEKQISHNVTTNGAWTSKITTSSGKTPTWISISPNSGDKAGDYTINIALETNTSGADRTATIIISTATTDISIPVTQKNVTTQGIVPIESVVINGVKWATRNVGASGTFVEMPENAGMFYQWNRSKAWNATDVQVTGWDNTSAAGTAWEKFKDPCPAGWRFPTKEEQQTLFDTQKVSNEWITQNNVIGRKFTDKATGNSLFFPAVGNRDNMSGAICLAGMGGLYWSSTPHESDETSAYFLYFSENNAGVLSFSRSNGFSIRPVLAK